MQALTFAVGTLEEGCALMCNLVGCKKQRVSKYAGVEPVLAGKCTLHERVLQISAGFNFCN